MANVIFSKDIQKFFTEVVNEYLAKGMMFNIGTMRGSQGEIAKVDLTDGTDVYRIRLHCESSYEDDYWGELMIVTIEKFAGCASDSMDDSTLWNDRGEKIFEKVWYGLDRNRKVFVETIEEAKACESKNRDRYRNRKEDSDNIIKVNSEDKLIVLRDMCRNHKGYGRVKKCHISHIIKQDLSYSTCYIVVFNNGKSPLMIKRIEK